METIFEYTFWLGLALFGLATLWLLFRLIRGPRKRAWIPVVVMLAGLGLMSAPAAIARQLPVDLGPRETIVNGERHITLTGWDQKDYSVLAQKPDTVVLQIANADVTDETLSHLEEMGQLLELDLNDTQVSDKGLRVLTNLDKLRKLFLRGTKITDEGFRKHILPHGTLKNLDLRQTDISKELIDEWKSGGSGRRAFR